MHMVAFKAATATTADTVAPSVPTGLAATATSTTQVGLTWTASGLSVEAEAMLREL
jgi:hypothetical protein